MAEVGQPRCELCGEPMPAGEEMFKFHGYSGPCPKPPKSKDQSGKKDKTAGQHIAERYFLDDEEALALARDIDGAIVNALDQEDVACAELSEEYDSRFDTETLEYRIRERIRDRRKT